jgi:hypothetical protein
MGGAQGIGGFALVQSTKAPKSSIGAGSGGKLAWEARWCLCFAIVFALDRNCVACRFS